MRQFATFGDLTTIGERLQKTAVLEQAKASLATKTLFLSHSHKDREFLPAVIQILENHGAKVYVDINDPAMPEDVSRETAARVRKAVEQCKKFVLFVTTRSKDSKWIPWELGLGDGNNREVNVALFPSADTWHEQEWSEREYLGLYKRIVYANFQGQTESHWMVYDHITNAGQKLADWIAQ